MTDFPRQVVHQVNMSGTNGGAAYLVLHPITSTNSTQRITIARKSREQQNFRYFDILLTRDQMYDLVGMIDERAALLRHEIPGV